MGLNRTTTTMAFGVLYAALYLYLFDGVVAFSSSSFSNSGRSFMLSSRKPSPVLPYRYQTTTTTTTTNKDVIVALSTTTTPTNDDHNEYYNENDEDPLNKVPKKVDKALSLFYRGYWFEKRFDSNERLKKQKGSIQESFQKGVRDYCRKENGLKFLIRRNNTILEYERKSDGRRYEYHVYPETGDLTVLERFEFPFNWRRVGNDIIQKIKLLLVGMISASVFKVPNYGLGVNFSLKNAILAVFGGAIWTKDLVVKASYTLDKLIEEGADLIVLIPVAIMIGAFLGMIGAFLVRFVQVPFMDENDLLEEVDFVDHSSRGSRNMIMPSLRANVGYMGNRIKPLQAILASAAMGLGAGLSEEILCRGVLQTVLSRRFEVRVAILLQAILFGLLHLGYGTKGYVLGTGIYGIFFGVMYQVTGNLATCILFHSLWDVFVSFLYHKLAAGLTNAELYDLFPPSDNSNDEVSSTSEENSTQ